MHTLAAFTFLFVVGSGAANSILPVSQQGPPAPVVGGSGEQVDSVSHVGHVHEGPGHEHPHQQQASPFQGSPNFYSPSGVIQVVSGGEQVPNNKPPSRAFEQYGQPEPAALPPNYKPFGSWGLYIGGNPADGYYSNYYKSLAGDKPASSSVDSAAPVAPKPALSPFLRQAGVAPQGLDYSGYYNPADLNSGSAPQYVSPVQAGASIYGGPSSVYDSPVPLAYADAYSTKRMGSSYTQQREVAAATKQQQVPQQQQEVVSPVQVGKGQQQRYYGYQPLVGGPLVGQLAAPGVAGQVVQQNGQVVAYPVPVGSQIVGSQPGVEGAFYPHGVHAFTRYAVKPTVVSNQVDQAYQYGVYGAPSQVGVAPQVPMVQTVPNTSYKQQYYSTVGSQSSPQYPLSFYGYPLSQLHYSSAVPISSYSSVVPSSVGGGVVSNQVGSSASPVEAGSLSSSVVSNDKATVSEDKVKPQ